MKPGYRTTEFWMSVIVVLVAASAALVEVGRGQLDAAGAVALVSSAATAAAYSSGRAAVKRASQGSGP